VAAELFLDSGFAIALASDSDQLHERASHLAIEIEANATRMVTTRAVVLEIGNSLAKLRYRSAAISLLDSLVGDPSVEIVPLSTELFQQAISLFRERPDKEWGLTDCASFVVMATRGLTDALTADGHFEQAGYRALLRHS
jgi:predicted nucleic acid-binding protein